MKCQTCIHRYVCKYLFIFSQKDFERCINYRIDESTVSKRRFAKAGKTHHIAEVGKKVKAYPVLSEGLCSKCKCDSYCETCTQCKGCPFEKLDKCPCDISIGQACKYFIRKDK